MKKGRSYADEHYSKSRKDFGTISNFERFEEEVAFLKELKKELKNQGSS